MQQHIRQEPKHTTRPASISQLSTRTRCANDDDLLDALPQLHRAADDGMQPCGIQRGDMLSIEHRATRSGEVVLARLNGQLLVRRLRRLGGQTLLLADQPDFPPSYILDNDDFELIGAISGRFRL